MEFLYPIVFWVLAALIAVSAIAMVLTQNIVRAATWLLFTLAGVAGIFFLLGADFVGATQLLVYVGGTLVLVVFGVMLTAQGPFINLKIGAGEWAIAAAAGLGFFTVLAYVLGGFELDIPATNPPPSAVAAATGVAPLASQGDDMHRTLAPSIILGIDLLGYERVAAEEPLTGVRYVSNSASSPGDAQQPPPRLQLKERTRVAYLLPFEIVSVHLLVVLIGAAYLARTKRRRGATS